MAANPKRSSKRRGEAITGRRSASSKPARPPKEASASRQRKKQARPSASVKETTQKRARGRRQIPQKTAGVRGAGPMDAVVAAQLEAIAHGLEQISDMRAELAELRTIIEELAQNVATLVANGLEQERGLDQPATTVTEEVLIVETDDSDSDTIDGEEEAEPF